MLSREHQVQDSKWFFVQDLFHQIITPFPVIQFWSSYSVSFKHSHIAMPSTNLRTKTLPFSPGSDNKRSANSPHQQTASTVGRNEMFELTLELKLYKISSNYTSLLEIPPPPPPPPPPFISLYLVMRKHPPVWKIKPGHGFQELL